MITGKPFLTTEQIDKKVKELAQKISKDYKGKDILAVGILKGAFMFFSDLVKLIQVPMDIDFITVSSYVKSRSSGAMNIHSDLREDVRKRHVLLIDDIVDTGLTLNYIKNLLLERKPASLKICTFLDKKSCRQADIKLDYVGYTIPNHYIVGYGLDYENKFRNLPYISIFKEVNK
ncbi:MAG: hypoxanthine phosphoribosyltransferase [Nitrospirota bacterium]|nr:hypoxanthine phosphoribosyltransferase [Nitrospirota bacterium]